MSEKIEIFVTIVQETPYAILVEHGYGPRVWIPKSQITDDGRSFKINDTVEIEIPVWLAEDKEMV